MAGSHVLSRKARGGPSNDSNVTCRGTSTAVHISHKRSRLQGYCLPQDLPAINKDVSDIFAYAAAPRPAGLSQCTSFGNILETSHTSGRPDWQYGPKQRERHPCRLDVEQLSTCSMCAQSGSAELAHPDNMRMRLMAEASRVQMEPTNHIRASKSTVGSKIQLLADPDDIKHFVDKSESFLENLLVWTIPRLPIRSARKWCTIRASTRHGTTHAVTDLVDRAKIRYITRAMIVSCAIAFVAFPMMILATNWLSDQIKFVALCCSTVAFVVVYLFVAKPSNEELFKAAATYCILLDALLTLNSAFSSL